MLSPSMMTNSKGNFPWAASITAAVWNWGSSPVPLSPMTAKRTESAVSGSLISGACAPARARPSHKSKQRRRIGLGDRVGDAIDDQIGIHIAQNQEVPHHAVFDLRRQGRQIQQQRRRSGLERRAGRVGPIDAQLI